MKVASPESLARLLHERLAVTGDPDRVVTLAELLDEVLPYAVVRDAVGLAGKAEYDIALLRFLCETDVSQVDPDLREAAEAQLDSPEPRVSFPDRLQDGLVRLRPAGDGPAPRPSAGTRGTAGGADDRTGSASPSAPAGAPVRSDPAAADGVAAAGDAAAAGEAAGADDAAVADPATVTGGVAATDEGATADRGTAPDEGTEPAEGAEPPALEEPRATSSPPRATSCPRCSDPVPARPGVRYCPHCGLDLREGRCSACGERLEADWRFCPRCGRSREA